MGKFSPEDQASFRESERSLCLLEDRLSRREIDYEEAVGASRALLADNPLNLKALSFLMDLSLRGGGSRLIRSEDFLGYFRPYFKLLGSYEGPLDPADELNVVFLSCHHTLILSLIGSERYGDALERAGKHSLWDPPGSLETNAFVGNLLIILKDYEGAERFLSAPPIPTPKESLYGLSLSRFHQGKHEEAISPLIKAFLIQPYVAELILRDAPNPSASWNLPKNDTLYFNALSYANLFLGAKVWKSSERAMSFLSWAYDHPAMLKKRAEAFSLLNRILYLPSSEFFQKTQLENAFQTLAGKADPDLIKAILRPVDFKGSLFRPWELFGYDRLTRIEIFPDGEGEDEDLTPGKMEGGSYKADSPQNMEKSPKRGTKGPFSGPEKPQKDQKPQKPPKPPKKPEPQPAPASLMKPDSFLISSAVRDPMSALSSKSIPPVKNPQDPGKAPEASFTIPPSKGGIVIDLPPEAFREGGEYSDLYDQGRGDSDDETEGEEETISSEESCGNCEDCENFEECSESSPEEDVDCVECSECEIEGFCTVPKLPKPKTPPYRH